MGMSDTRVLGTAEAAEYCGLDVSVLTHATRVGELARTDDGFRETGLRKWLASRNEIPAPHDHPRTGKRPTGITALSFFSGAMGLDIGLAQAGIHPLLHCEFDREARMTIQSNTPGTALIGDINGYDAASVRRMAGLAADEPVDLVYGGPPCQAFSTAGLRRGLADERGNVFLKYLDLAFGLKARYVLIENVRGLLSAEWPVGADPTPVPGGVLSTVLRRFREAGYVVSFNLYDSRYFGAGESRERVILIARRGGGKPPAWLTPTTCDNPIWGLPRVRTLRDALTPVESGAQHGFKYSEAQKRVFSLVKPGGNWRNLPPDIQRKAMGGLLGMKGGRTGAWRRLRWDAPCPTLTTNPLMRITGFCHPEEVRPLSVEEYKAVQGFPPDWIIRGSLTAQYRQIGNAVPIPLARAAGKAVLADMRGEQPDPRYRGFPRSRYQGTDQLSFPDPGTGLF